MLAARGVDRRRVPGRAGANDKDSGVMPFAHAAPYGGTVTRRKELHAVRQTAMSPGA